MVTPLCQLKHFTVQGNVLTCDESFLILKTYFTWQHCSMNWYSLCIYWFQWFSIYLMFEFVIYVYYCIYGCKICLIQVLLNVTTKWFYSFISPVALHANWIQSLPVIKFPSHLSSVSILWLLSFPKFSHSFERSKWFFSNTAVRTPHTHTHTHTEDSENVFLLL
jgi:hypothetical protein